MVAYAREQRNTRDTQRYTDGRKCKLYPAWFPWLSVVLTRTRDGLRRRSQFFLVIRKGHARGHCRRAGGRDGNAREGGGRYERLGSAHGSCSKDKLHCSLCLLVKLLDAEWEVGELLILTGVGAHVGLKVTSKRG